ncbi:MAG: tetratricopeptide repeat protein [Deltaproteobacteria bacterium]
MNDQTAEELDVSVDLGAEQPASATPSPLPDPRALLASYEREAHARGADASAAALHFAMGRIWEVRLRSPREAAASYQNAYRLDPQHRPNLSAARRLFCRVGNWQMALQLVDAELAAGPTPAQRRALSLERGHLLADRMGASAEAAATFRELLSEDPSDTAAAVALEAMALSSGDPEALVDAYRREAAAVGDPSVELYCLTAAASLLEDRLERPDEAAELYRAAHRLSPGDPAALAGLCAHAERLGQWEELVEALLAEGRQSKGSTAAALLYQAAQVCSERLDREPDALAALIEARKAAPDDPLVLEELARIYEHKGLWAEYAEILETRLASRRSSRESVELSLRLAELYEERLEREDDAIARYRALLELSPGHPGALAALGKLHHRRGEWQLLLATYDAEIASLEDLRQRAAKLYKAGELLEERLDRVEEAIGRYAEVLRIQPGFLPAQKALTRLYETTGQFPALIELYEREIATTRDRDQRIALWTRIAALSEERLKDPERAVKAHLAILEENPDHLPTIRSLSQLCERSQRWRQLIWANELEAGLTGDQKQVISLFHRNCELLEEQLGDKDGAIEAYRKVLSLSPSYLPALRALGRLYAQKGRWDELVQMFRQEADVAVSSEEAASLVLRIGELYEDKLGREEQALSAYREVLTLQPQHGPALEALERIFRSRRQWDQIAEVLRTQAAARTAPEERAPILFHLGEICERYLTRTDLAVDAYQEVLRLVPHHVLALRALDRLFSAAGCWRELAAVHERLLVAASPGPERAQGYLRLGRLYGDRLGDSARAAQCLEASLEGEVAPTTAIVALKALERVQGLIADRAGRARTRERLAGLIQSPRLAASVALLAGQDREDVSPGPEEARAAAVDYQRAHVLRPDEPAAEEALEEALRRSGDRAGLVPLLERRISGAGTPAEVATAALELAEIHGEAGRLDAALAACRRGLGAEPGSVPLLQHALSLSLAAGQPAEARATALALAEALSDGELAIEALGRAAALAEELRDVGAAVSDYRRMLARDPLHRQAAARLSELLESTGDSSSLLELRERQGLTLVARGDLGGVEVLLGVAATLSKGQADLARALGLIDRALTLAPQDQAALLARGEVLSALSRPEEAVEALRRAAEAATDPERRSGAHLRVAVLLQDQLADPDRASVHLQAAAAANPRNAEALERLARLHEAGGNWAGAARALELLEAAEPSTPAMIRALLLHARVLLDGLGDGTGALEKVRQAHGLLPEDTQSLSLMCTLEQRLRDWEGAASTCERLAVLNATKDPAAARSFRLRAGEICVQELRRPGDAIANFRRALEAEPDDVATRAALAELYAADPAHLSDAIAEQRSILLVDPARPASYQELHRIFGIQGQIDRAYCASAVLSFLSAADDAVQTSHAESRKALPADGSDLTPELRERILPHPDGRSPLTALLRLLGEPLGELLPWPAEEYPLSRGDRLKADHPVRHLCDLLAQKLGAPELELEVYQAKGLELAALPTSPPTLVIGAQIIRKFQSREQRFLLGRLVERARDGSAIAAFAEPQPLCDALGAALRLVLPGSRLVGRPNEELEKRLAKLLSRKTRKALEELAPSLARPFPEGGLAWARSLGATSDRAGLFLCGDIAAGLTAASLVDGKELLSGGARSEGLSRAVRELPRLGELVRFAVSDDLHQLRSVTRLVVSA